MLPRRVVTKLLSGFPQGGSLPVEEWTRRHNVLCGLLWSNAIALPLYGVLSGASSARTALSDAAAIGTFAVLGSAHALSRRLRMVCVALGLLTATALLIAVTSGRIESHFYFFVVIIALTLYEEWSIFLMAVTYVLIHHGVIGTLQPGSVFNVPDEVANPWKWAAIHAGFVAAAGAAALGAWRLNEDVRAEMRTTHRKLEEASLTDSLTGLGNRRLLMADLQETLASQRNAVLIMADLDGFKAYNDSFGHPAGDSLLARLGRALSVSFSQSGGAYRLGGDEFCVIVPARAVESRLVEARAVAALSERGDGFAIGASVGAVMLPDEADNAEAALKVADQRMYSAKNGSRPSSRRQTTDALLQALAERHPDIEPHFDAVTALAGRVARRLGLRDDQIEEVRHAAALHDIGKVAIPDAILLKPGPLDAAEGEFMRRHTIIGERIVAAAPSLEAVSKLVRSSHEHFDGSGYPDALSGDGIPIGSRIILVCDAFDAMTTDRSYSQARPAEAAVAELENCSGTQFDPSVVEAFLAELRIAGVREALPAGNSASAQSAAPARG